MTHPIRDITLSFCGFVILAALSAYIATGAAAFTRYPSEEIAKSNEQDDLAALFDEETGLSDELGELQGIENRFTMGLLPSGPGRDGLSLATTAGPALAIIVVTLLIARRKRDPHLAQAPQITDETSSSS